MKNSLKRSIPLLLIVCLSFLSGQVSTFDSTDYNIIDPSVGQIWTHTSADLDGDGRLDLLAGLYTEDKLVWYKNLGDGLFGEAQEIASGEEVNDVINVKAADIDNDGDLDVFSLNYRFAYPKLGWYENLGDGTFSERTNIGPTEGAGLSYPWSLHLGDMDGDQDLDVFISHSGDPSSFVWYENLGDATFGPEIYLAWENDGHRFFFIDIDGDQDEDFVFYNSLPNTQGRNSELYWMENVDNVFETFHLIRGTDTGNTIRVQSLWCADIDGDGDNDVITGERDYGPEPDLHYVGFYENLDGLGNFGEFQNISSNVEIVRSISAADLDLDGDVDIVSTSYDGKVAWYENLGSSFGDQHLISEQIFGATTLYLEDYDADGDIDVSVSGFTNDQLFLFNNRTINPFLPQTKEELQTAVDLWISDNATALSTYGEINTWDVTLITDMVRLFQNKDTFNDSIGNWDVSNVTAMYQIFEGASSFNQDISNWDVSNVTNMYAFFKGASSFNQDLTNWNVSSVTAMHNMFQQATNFNGDVEGWDVSNVVNFDDMFAVASSFNGDLSAWDVSSATRMNSMFYNTSFNGDISGWDVSNVGRMGSTFRGNSVFNQDISGWNVSSVFYFTAMFQSANSFNQDLASWDVSSATRMDKMFVSTTFNQDLASWDVSNVTKMDYMFQNSDFNGDITTWDVSSVLDMEDMFSSTDFFNQDISGWDVSNVTDFIYMFKNALSFNQDISSWDVSNVTRFQRMFQGAESFDQDLSPWDISSATSMSEMFLDANALSAGNKCSMNSAFSSNENWLYDWDEFCVYGCADSYAANYNLEANSNDGSCFGYPDNEDYYLSFDGADDYVDIENNLSGTYNQFTISTWVKVDDFTSSYGPHYVLSIGNNESSKNLSLFVNVQGIGFSKGAPGADGEPYDFILNSLHNDTTDWMHVALSWSGTDYANMYINGNLVENPQYQSGATSLEIFSGTLEIDNGSPVYLGTGNYNGTPEYFSGGVDETSLWSRALTQEEIQAHMTNSVVGNEENLLAYWKANTGDEDILYDHSGYANHGSLIGPSWICRDPDCSGVCGGTAEIIPYWPDSDGDGFGSGETFSRGHTLDFTRAGNVTIPYNSEVFDFSDNDFTVAFHLKRDEIVGVARLFGNAVNEGCGTDQWSSRFWVELRSEGTANHLQVISSGAGSYNTGVIIDDLDWHHLIIMRDNDSLYVYYDHVLSFTTSFAGTIVSHCADFQIGTNLSLGNGIDGQMDDFAIWNRAITEQERIALQNPGISLVDGLVGYWNFNEGSGTVATDATGNCENGVVSGGTWVEYEEEDGSTLFCNANPPEGWANNNHDVDDYVSDGCTDPYASNYNPDATADNGSCDGYPDVANYSLFFDDVESPFIELGDVLDQTAYTKTMWIKSDGTRGGFVFSGPGSHGLALNAAWGWILISGHNGEWRLVESGSITINEWTFVALSYDPNVDSGTLKLYLNGNMVSSATGVPVQENTTNAYIGSYSNSGGTFGGWIDEVTLWHRALTDGDVIQIMNSQLPTNSDQLVGHWTFNSGADTIAYDHSGSANHGQIIGADWTLESYYTPDKPTGVNAVPGDGEVALNWDVSNDTSVTYYHILGGTDRNNLEHIAELPATATSFVYSGLENDIRVYFELIAHNMYDVPSSGVSASAMPYDQNSENFSLHFDGKDDYVEILHSAAQNIGEISGNQGTIVAAIKRSYSDLPENKWQRIVSKKTHWTNSGGYELEFHRDETKYNLNAKDSSQAFGEFLSNGNWEHVAVTFNNNIARMYLNGNDVTVDSLIDPVMASTDNLWIGLFSGADSSQECCAYDGWIDEVALYNKALSQEQIQDIVINGVQVTEDIEAYYDFDQGNGSTASDLSGNQNHGTIHGASWSSDFSDNDLSRITFNFDLRDQVVHGDGVHIAGGFNGWESNVSEMTDADGDGVYTYEGLFHVGDTIYYKFINGNDWSHEHDQVEDLSCGGALGYNNRWLAVPDFDVELDPACISSCVECSDTPIAPNYSLKFDGEDDLITIPAEYDPDAYTTEAWVKINNIAAMNIFVRTGNSNPTSSWSHQLRITSDGKFQHYVAAPGAKTVTGSTTVVPGVWYHVSGTAESNGIMRLYVNGQEEGTAQSINNLWSGGSQYLIGSNSGNSMGYFDGLIDEVRVWDLVRDVDDIHGNMNNSISGDEDNLIGYWKFNSGEGSVVVDHTSNGNNGNIEGAVWDDDVPYGGSPVEVNFSLLFDGDDYIDVGDNATYDFGSTLSIEAWIKPSSLSARHGIFTTRRYNDDNSFQLEVGTYNTSFGNRTNYVAITGLGTWFALTGDNAISLDQWNHIVFTRNGQSDNGSIYVNGVAQEINSSNSNYQFNNNDAPKEIGRGTQENQHFEGLIDRITVWSRALTAGEVQSIMYSNLDANESGLVGYWRGNTGSGEILYDYSGNLNHGAINGASWNDEVPYEISTETTPTIPKPNNVLAMYDFSGATYDLSGNGHHGTIQGGVTLTEDKDGRPNSAYYFDGAGGTRIHCGSGIELANKSHTISIMAKRDNSSYDGHFFGHGAPGSSTGLHCRTQGNLIRYGFWNNDLDVNNTYSTSLDWHHYVFVYDYDLGTRKVYIDGNLMSPAGENTSPYVGTGDFAIGCINGSSNSGSWLGSLDDVIVWDVALSESEIQEIGSPEVNISDAYWSLQVRAWQGPFNDYGNFLRVASDATNSFDLEYDQVATQSGLDNSVSVDFVGSDGVMYNIDTRPNISLSDTMQVWEFDVSADFMDGDIFLDFTYSDSVPDVPVILENLSTGHRHHVEDSSPFSFYAEAGNSYSFKVSIGDTTDPTLALGDAFNGPKILISDSTHSLTWVADDGYEIDSVVILFSNDGGVSFIEQVAFASAQNNVDWVVPDYNDITDAMFMVRAKDYSGNVTEKHTEHPLTIVGDSLGSSVSAGWTLWGVPMIPDNDSMAVNLGDDISGYWSTFDYIDNGYTYVGHLKEAEGYWLASLEGAEIDVLGTPIASDYTLSLSQGWDLISNPLVLDVIVDSLVFTKDGGSKLFSDAVSEGWINTVYGYNGSGYETSDMLSAWSGYWIAVLDSGVSMTIPVHDAPVQQERTDDEEAQENWMISVSANTENGLSNDLLSLGYDQQASDGFDPDFDAFKPPVSANPDHISLFMLHPEWGHPFGDKFVKDIRSVLPESGFYEWRISVESSESQAVLSWTIENVPDDYEIGYSLDGGGFYHDMRSVGDEDIVTISVGSDLIVRVGSSVLGIGGEPVPDVYALQQNYPNPFNPITKIQYQLPQDNMVKLSVYDIMGRKVKTLVNSAQSAGYKVIVWDATNDQGSMVSAGMYFYAIEAGDFRKTKKMILLK